ncbi:MAG: beta strand repeat-containing protein [Candidatus Sumerlaeaceae bacterium]
MTTSSRNPLRSPADLIRTFGQHAKNLVAAALGVALIGSSVLAQAQLPGESSDVGITKTAPANTTVGSNITYTIVVTNHGPGPATGVTMVDVLPLGATYVSSSSTVGTTSNVLGTETATIGNLASGQSATILLTATAGLVGLLPNSAAVVSTSLDLNQVNNVALASTEVGPSTASSDVGITKTAPASAVIGSNFDYTLTVTNNGPDTAVGITAMDVLPLNVTYVSSSSTVGTTSFELGIVTASIPSLASGASAVITITVQANLAGPVVNTAEVSVLSLDSNPLNNVAITITNLGVGGSAASDISVNKLAPASAALGSNFDYTIVVTNSGPDAATGVELLDVLPPIVTYVSSSSTIGTTSFAAIPGTVTASIGTLAAGASATVTITVTATLPGVAVNTATANLTSLDATPLNNVDVTETLILTGELLPVDVSIVKSAPATAVQGTNFTYTLTVANAGPNTASNVIVTDVLPVQVAPVSAASTAGTPSFTGNVMTVSLGDMAAGATHTITVLVTANLSGLAVNTAEVVSASPDAMLLNNISAVTTIILPAGTGNTANLSINKQGPANATQGSSFAYTLTVTNTGPNPAVNVVVTDVLPAQVTYVSSSASAGSTSQNLGVVTANLGDMAVGQVQTVTINVTASLIGIAANTAVVNSSTVDPAPADNSDVVLTTITTGIPPVLSANVAIVKSAPAAATVGNNFNYTLTVSNNGPDAAIAVVVTDVLPAQVSYVTGSSTAGTVSHVAGVVTAQLGNMASGAVATISITVSANVPGLAVNTAQVFTTSVDANGTNNISTASTLIGSGGISALPTNLSITKSASADFVEAGTTFTYTLVYQNNGPNVGVNVQVADTMPAGLTILSVSATGGGVVNSSSSAMTVDYAVFPAGTSQSAVILVYIQPSTIGIVTNTATISGANEETTQGDNSASATILVDAFTPGCGPDLGGAWPVTTSIQRATTTSLGYKAKVKFLGKIYITNLGSVVTTPTLARYFLSTDQKWDSGDLLVGAKKIKPIKPGAFKKLKVKAKIPIGINPTGKYLLVVIGNPAFDSVEECRQSNNFLISSKIPPPLPKKR